jgi:hypothetical protein
MIIFKEETKHKRKRVYTDIVFSEHYVYGYSSEMQSVHFGGKFKQLTLQTGEANVKSKKPSSFCTDSESLVHGLEAV